MTADLRHAVFIVTIICYFHITSSNNITSGLSKAADAIGNILHLNSSQCILPGALCGDDIRGKLDKILNLGPSLKEDIAKLENTHLLEKFKAGDQNEDKDLPITQLIAKYGYHVQNFTVETEDGYLLALYRIPGKGDPVLLVQGITLSAVDWFTVGRESALPCLLADRGYDVWVLDNRGMTKESQRHVKLSLKEDADQYWDFSFNELGRYDLPATVDFILRETGKPKLKYVGFSQGTAIFYVMASERPEYAAKISLMVSLAPVAWIPNVKSPLFKFAHIFSKPLDLLRKGTGLNSFNAENPLVNFLTEGICGTAALALIVCTSTLIPIIGFDYAQANATQLPVIFGHYPSTFSIKQLIHYGQLVGSAKFRQYDYDTDQNMAMYGSEQPPDYPVEKISTPVALFYSKDDWGSAYEDVLTLKGKLPNVVDFYEIPLKKWNHVNYLWAKDVKALVYDRLLELFQKY
ncbi:alpha/beta hydrolase fold domain-containing protein [Phthorimaea operculella]|nr:alpha/beta hydrolase fold domain-containing protein [Phthorimaea operculella]